MHLLTKPLKYVLGTGLCSYYGFLLKEDKWMVTVLLKYKQALSNKFSVYESL